MSFNFRAPRHVASGRIAWRAMTLVEMLIAMALTMILVYAIAEFYARIGPSVKDGRAMIDLVAQLRTATARLRADLERLTLIPRPPSDDDNSPGYFEYFEGRGNDIDTNANNLLDATEDSDTNSISDFVQYNYSTMLGDIDDVLAFTIRTDGDPLVGYGFAVNLASGIPDYATPAGFSSPRAEVVWFSSFIDQDGDNLWDPNERRLLHRRQLIVNESLNVMHSGDANVSFPYFMRIPVPNPDTSVLDGMKLYDVSLEQGPIVNGYRYFFARRFHDLTRRENRFAHLGGPANFSNRIDIDGHVLLRDNTALLTDAANYGSLNRWVQSGLRQGDDVILANALAFDVRVFDPSAAILADNSDATGQGTPADPTDDAQGTVQPGDSGWATSLTNGYPIVGYGAYVDLWYSRYATPVASPPNPTPIFAIVPAYAGPAPGAAAYRSALGATYDTWALSYDRDGVDQLGDGQIDLGTNGFDDDGFNGVDDALERETTPPYPVPLRGIQVEIRVSEPTTRQVRQATIGWDFITE